jgi:hypothetical protein
LLQALLKQEVFNIDAVKGLLYWWSVLQLTLSAVLCCDRFDCDLQALLKQEVLNIDAVEGLLGKRPFTSATMQNIDRYRCGCCCRCGLQDIDRYRWGPHCLRQAQRCMMTAAAVMGKSC